MFIRKVNQNVNQKGKSECKSERPFSASFQAKWRHHTQAQPAHLLGKNKVSAKTDLSVSAATSTPQIHPSGKLLTARAAALQQAEQSFLLWWGLFLSEVLLIITNICYLKIYIPISYRNNCCQFITDSCINQMS